MKKIFSLLLLSLCIASCDQQIKNDLKTETVAIKEKTCGCSDERSPYVIAVTSITPEAGCSAKVDILTANFTDTISCNLK